MKKWFIFMFCIFPQSPNLKLCWSALQNLKLCVEVLCILTCLGHFPKIRLSFEFLCFVCLLSDFLHFEEVTSSFPRTCFTLCESIIMFHFYLPCHNTSHLIRQMQLHVFHLIHDLHMHVIPFSASIFTHLTFCIHSHDMITRKALCVIASQNSVFYLKSLFVKSKRCNFYLPSTLTSPLHQRWL